MTSRDEELLDQTTYHILEKEAEAWKNYIGHPYDIVLKMFAIRFKEMEKRLKALENKFKEKE